VTVIRPGGVGKTQLVPEVARRIASSFTNGAAFVDLADVDDPALVDTEIARSLDLVDVSGPEPTEGLHSALRNLRMLLVIDNFEHLVAAARVSSFFTATHRFGPKVGGRARRLPATPLEPLPTSGWLRRSGWLVPSWPGGCCVARQVRRLIGRRGGWRAGCPRRPVVRAPR